MKLQFKVQQYQTEAVDAVVESFTGQPRSSGVSYRLDSQHRAKLGQLALNFGAANESCLRNAEIALSPSQLLENIQTVQRRRNLQVSGVLATSNAASPCNTPNLDIEMETGTGKTYVYIKTIMELNKCYGWSKFIVVVPSVAIREGVKKSFDTTAEHFQQTYATKPRSFIYNSSHLHELEQFSSDSGVQVMIINIQAFNATGKDNRRIYDVLDDFQSRRPIDVVSATRPIVIIDEPQKIGAAKSLESLSRFNALMILRYSATHKTEHNKVHRLDALDAYNEKLVKRISVRGITVKGLSGSAAYLYLDAIEIAKGAKPRALIELEVQTKREIRRQMKKLDVGANLYKISGEVEAYKGLFIVDIDANRDIVELSNGDIISAGQVTSDVTDEAKRRIQIREVIRAHLDKEHELFAQGVKVLSLFFIDEVVKYRDYSREDTLGEYARVFQEEYEHQMADTLNQLEPDGGSRAYREHLASIAVKDTHRGYFSIDKKTKRFVNPGILKRGEEAGQSTDTDAYDLILRDKERLLSFAEPVRFIFSHSALREGWDNPNVFVMGMLKKSDRTVSRRQEIGRGLRLAVDQNGERMDNPATVHDINELTVVTDESYTDFVSSLQKEIDDSLVSRPRKADTKYFVGKVFMTESGEHVVDYALANALYKYLVKNDYIKEDDDTISETYKIARSEGSIAEPTSDLLKPLVNCLLPIIDALYIDIPCPEDGRKPKRIPLNEENFAKKEFRDLWGRISHKAIYQVEFDSDELLAKCVAALDTSLNVVTIQYLVRSGQQHAVLDADDLAAGTGFSISSTSTYTETISSLPQAEYDLLGEVAEKTQLTRRTTGAILGRLKSTTFAKYQQNPEQFITEASRLINEQKATIVVEHLTYNTLNEQYATAIFTANQTRQDFAKAGQKLKKHIYDYVVTDSKVERDFVAELDVSTEVVVYAKLPRGFLIPTPVGGYNPDWAISFQEGTVKHIYFVAETKGSLSSMQLRPVEEAKIACARKFFAELNRRSDRTIEYNVVTDYTQLMQLVGTGT